MSVTFFVEMTMPTAFTIESNHVFLNESKTERIV